LRPCVLACLEPRPCASPLLRSGGPGGPQLESELIDPLGPALDERERQQLSGQQQGQQQQGQQQQGQQQQLSGQQQREWQALQPPLGERALPAPSLPPPAARGIARLAFAPGLGALVAVMADGAAALCAAEGGRLRPLEGLGFARWLCGPEAG
jgi:hypothetical protein